MAKAFVSVDCSELVALSKQLKDFFDPSVAKPSPLGKAVAAGARNVYLELQRQAPENKDGSAAHPGLLKRSVYRYWDPKGSPDANRISYFVGVNMRKAPHFHLADEGHYFYRNYKPFVVSESPLRFRSRNKDSGRPLGAPYKKAKAHRYLEKAFNPSVLANALDIVTEVYMEQFTEAMARS